ncbi:MAG: CPBP family intramembrane metalloprotease [Gammaproteobacteria bacterium]|nr:CPBP family intramembrane metalloprotease [Gammaproteobacteria bacterium]
MDRKQWLGAGLVVLGGFVFFNVLMGIAMGLVFFNAKASPGVAWFPLPALALIIAATWWARGRWDMRLAMPPNVPWGRVYAFGFLAMLAAKCIKGIEGAYHEVTLVAPAAPENVSAVFALLYLFMVPFFAAVLAEIAFRGIIQTRMEKTLPLWQTLLFVSTINTLSHAGFTDISTQWLYLMAVNLGFCYTTWLAQSIVPAIVVHVAMNVLFPAAEHFFGPLGLGELSAGGIVTLGVLGATLSALAAWLAGGVQASVARAG